MAFATRTYTPGSSTTDFALTNADGNPIGYIQESDIKVTVNGTVFTNAASGSNTYQFTGATSVEQPGGTTIRLNAGVTGTVILDRTTAIQNATVVYTAGATLTATDLNNADNQIRFGLQEFSDDYAALFTGTGNLTTLSGFKGGSDTWVSSDAFAATTGAIDGRVDTKIDAALVGDVSGGDGVSIVDNTPNAGQIRVDLDPDIATLRTMQSGAAATLASLTSTELNILDGCTRTTDQLNFVDATSSIQTQINSKQAHNTRLDDFNNITPNDGVVVVGDGSNWVGESGTTARASLSAQESSAKLTELATMNQNTAEALADLTNTEVQILDGLTATTDQLNRVDATSSIQNQLNGKQASDPDLTAIAGLSSADGNVIVGSASGWVAESGATARTSLGAQTQDAQLDTLSGMQAGTASVLSGSTALGATLAEINSICENREAETSITVNADNRIPTSKAVNDRILTVTNALGGFVAIANEASFPNAHPDPGGGAGTVVSIADVGGLVVNSSGVATNASTVGGTAVTINGIATTFRSTTMTAGVGMQVQTTSTLNTYDYHKAILREQDISSISTDIEDFGNRYRVGSSNPTSDNDPGDLFFNTGSDKMLVRNAANNSWDEVQSVGNFFISTLSPAFDGSTIDFTVTNAPANAEQIILSINGVIQQPNAGTGRPTDGFSLNGSTIQLPTGTGPAANTPHFVIVLGSTVNIGTPSNNTVTNAILQSGCVDNAKVATNAAIAGSKIAPDFGSQNIVTTGTIAAGSVSGNLSFGDNNITNVGEISLDKIKPDGTNVSLNMGTDKNILFSGSIGEIGDVTGFQATNDAASANTSFGMRANDIRFATGSSERVRITDTGVGIGLTNPSSKLHIRTSTNHNLEIEESSGDLRISALNDARDANEVLQFAASAFQFLTGTVAINSDSAIAPLNVRAMTDGNLHVRPITSIHSGTGVGLDILNNGNSAVQDLAIRAATTVFRHASAESMRITSTGSIGVNETSPSFSGFGSNGGGIELDDVNTSFTAVKVSHGAADLYLVSAGSAVFISTRTDHDIVIEKNTAEVARFTANGLKVASGKGIDFSSTSDGGGMSSELLDDYEEGEFDPVVRPENNTFSITMHGDTGAYYTKVGRQVFVSGCVRWTAFTVGNASGNLFISLPFTPAARDNGDNSDDVWAFRVPVWNGNNTPTMGLTKQNSANMNLMHGTMGDDSISCSNGDTGSTGMVQFSGHFRV